ncbi:mucin-2-like [Palaemon carinicauda]|uniref:mucin-2-like n=1 Tax=Palaemon carinicauda TaxID=392227 RepID=UPI0035B6383B
MGNILISGEILSKEKRITDCEFNGQRYSEGSRVSVTGDKCEHCYCIGGQVNCTTYCDDTNDKTSADEFPKGFPAHESKGDLDDQTSGGSRRSAFKGHINMARMSRGEDAIITDLTEAKSLLRNTTSDEPLETTNDENSEPEELTEEEESQADDQEEEENTENSPDQVTRKRVTNRRRLTGGISRPSRDDIENRRKQTRFTTQRIPPRIRPPQSVRPITRPNPRIKFNKERKQSTFNSASKIHTSSESTTTTTTLKQTATTDKNDLDKANELDTTIQNVVDQTTRSYANSIATTNGPSLGTFTKSHDPQNLQSPSTEANDSIPVSSERSTTTESQARPTRFSRLPFPPRRPFQRESLSSRLKSRNELREKNKNQESTTTRDLTTPARFLRPSFPRTTPLLSSTTTEEPKSFLTSNAQEITTILPTEVEEDQASISPQEVTERPQSIISSETTEESVLINTERETSQTDDYTQADYELGTTIPQDIETVTSGYDDATILYNLERETDLLYNTEVYQGTEYNSSGDIGFEPLYTYSTQRVSTLDPLLPENDSTTTDDPTVVITTQTPFPASISQSTATATSTILTSTMSEDEILPEISRSGHAGAAFLVPGIYELSSPTPNRNLNINKAVEVGTGVNVKGNLDNAVAFGPILISDNKVRVDRQNREFNATEETETTAVDSTVATEFPEETTFITADEINITNDASTNDESSIDYETGTEEITTVFPTLSLGRDTTIKSLSELLSQATTEPTSTTTGVPSSTPESVDYIVAGDLEDTETNFPSYDITVGTSVLARPLATGVGEVIPVDIEPEHKSPEIESGPVIQEKNPTLLTALLNILTRTEPPRPETISPQSGPERLPPPPPPPGRLPPPTGRLPPPPTPGRLPPPPGRLPPPPPPPSSSFIASSFRPRPRPNSRPSRPDFIPPRFRPPPPPKATERDTTEEPETSTDPSSASPIIFVPTASEADFIAPTTESTGVVNKPVSGFGRPDHIANIPIHIVNNEDEIPIPDLPNRHVVEINSDINSRNNLPTIPDYFHNQPLATPPRVNSPTSPERLPSKPVIEGGFQAIKDEGIEPNFDNDYEYDEYGSPILPPSLPNLQIIPFEVGDALVKKQEIGIAGDEFKSPILLRETSSDNPENQRTPDTTEVPTTTTRRSLLHPPIGDRRHAILPSHRRPYPSNRPGTDTSTRRPFVPPRRPGDRPTRAPPIFTTKTTSRPEDESELTDIDESSFSSAKPIIPFEEVPSFIPPRHTTQNTEEITTTAILTTSTTTPLQTTTPTTTSSTTTTTPAPVVSNDIINLLLQDPSRLAEGQSRPPVRFTQQHTTPKPRIPIKVTTALPAIPEAVKNQMPLVTDPVLASGLLKLSGCNIYGRLYAVGGQITELTTGCKECRCTHLGVQCLPVC